MTEVAARELRNDTAGLLRRAAAGEDIVITVHGRPAARLVPVTGRMRQWLSREDLAARLAAAQPVDPGLRADLIWISGDTTDDLGPVQ